MAADGVVVGFYLDAAAVGAEVVPVEQGGAERSDQAVGDVTGAWCVVVVFFRQGAAQHRDGGPHHVHRVAGRRQGFESRFHAGRQAAQRLEFFLVAGELGVAGQLAVYQQVGDFLEFAGGGEVEDVIAAVVQVVAGATDGAQGGVAGGNTGEGDRFLGLGKNLQGFAHVDLQLLKCIAVNVGFIGACRKRRARPCPGRGRWPPPGGVRVQVW